MKENVTLLTQEEGLNRNENQTNNQDGDWHYAEEIRANALVDAAIGEFMKDPTADKATLLIRDVIRTIRPIEDTRNIDLHQQLAQAKQERDTALHSLAQSQEKIVLLEKDLAEEKETNEYNYTNLDHIASFLVLHDCLEFVCNDDKHPLGAAINIIASFQKIQRQRSESHKGHAFYQWLKEGVAKRQGVSLNKLERKIDKSESKNLLSFSFFGTPEELDSVISTVVPNCDDSASSGPQIEFPSHSVERRDNLSKRKASYLRNQGYADYSVTAVLRKGRRICLVCDNGAVRWLGYANTTYYPQRPIETPTVTLNATPETANGPWFDYQLKEPSRAALVASICEETWLFCVENWKKRPSLVGCEYSIAHSDIVEGMTSFGIIRTGKDGYLEDAITYLSAQMYALGYLAKARQLFLGTLDLASL